MCLLKDKEKFETKMWYKMDHVYLLLLLLWTSLWVKNAWEKISNKRKKKEKKKEKCQVYFNFVNLNFSIYFTFSYYNTC